MGCPFCDKDMELIEAEPDVGIMHTAWYCTACEKSFDDEGEEL